MGIYNKLFFLLIIFGFSFHSYAQDDINMPRRGAPNRGQSRSSNARDTSIGFKHRDDLKDSITISYRYLDSLRSNKLASSLSDFSTFFSVPANYFTLGNNGSAAFPVLYAPILKSGWDAGFHAYDAYKFTLEGTRFRRLMQRC